MLVSSWVNSFLARRPVWVRRKCLLVLFWKTWHSHSAQGFQSVKNWFFSLILFIVTCCLAPLEGTTDNRLHLITLNALRSYGSSIDVLVIFEMWFMYLIRASFMGSLILATYWQPEVTHFECTGLVKPGNKNGYFKSNVVPCLVSLIVVLHERLSCYHRQCVCNLLINTRIHTFV